ncbi:WD40/YVTN/BNR-like repeat-containing protein [Roseateles amylovorans]|uniref:Exo-alpha-sialidase n=1 Tax=Roseateles amylovorans TaxID=2978473 RepID=A0ABY6B560_9BURK|nr:exo-alpha-sialidase [Roseateles amylovorans]UXH79680.1 exo-alpha-sialidase [Roseateles amylovorans]
MSTTAWVATRKGLFEMNQRAGDAWTLGRHSFVGDPVTMLLPAPPGGGRMLAALNLGHFGVKLQGSDDGGVSWQELPSPAFPPQPPDAEGPAWTVRQIWSLERGADGRIWAGTIPGGLFVSGDEGASWRLVDSLWHRAERLGWFGGGYDAPGIHSICIDLADPDRLLLGISCGGAWRSDDGGATWRLSAKGMLAAFMPPEQAGDENTQDPHRIVACEADPRVLWCQHHNGVWRSDDAGANWQALDPPISGFGFGVAAHAGDPLTAWFVPGVKDEKRLPVDGALVVNRTRDGGRSFDTLRSGLPQQHCYDLVYRHGLVAHEDGRRLLMGSTTGNLWATGDAGDHWRSVSHTLPPIYAVRFG